jgi:hypothetical protein
MPTGPAVPGFQYLPVGGKLQVCISRTLKVPLDTELDGEQLCYSGPTPDSEGNYVKIASKVRVALHCVQADEYLENTTLTLEVILTSFPSKSGVGPYQQRCSPSNFASRGIFKVLLVTVLTVTLTIY